MWLLAILAAGFGVGVVMKGRSARDASPPSPTPPPALPPPIPPTPVSRHDVIAAPPAIFAPAAGRAAAVANVTAAQRGAAADRFMRATTNVLATFGHPEHDAAVIEQQAARAALQQIDELIARQGHMTTTAPMPPSGGKIQPPSLARWALFVAQRCKERGIQVPYTVQWLKMESGGNPCAVGYPAAKGPDGNPREMGIAQFYNPDDLVRLKLTGTELRAYCMPGDQHDINYRGKMIKGFSQEMTRDLTDAEMKRQADGTCDLITRSMSSATTDLMHVHASAAWSPTQRNYWALVKLQHGLPALSRDGLPLVSKYLGRAPSSFHEFRQAIESGNVKLDAKIESEYRDSYPRIFDNAEECAAAFVEGGVA